MTAGRYRAGCRSAARLGRGAQDSALTHEAAVRQGSARVAHLALYLALGWTQATTTWQWPGTERWIAVLSGPPPAHWLPRSQWHLCWLLHDRESVDHRRALDEALAEGLADAELPGVGAVLKEVLGI